MLGRKPPKRDDASLHATTANAASPLNELEEALFAAMAGRLSMDEFLAVLVRSEVAIPSTTEVQDDGRGLNPVVYDRNGTPMAAVYTDLSRLPAEPQVPFCLKTKAAWLIKGMSAEFGLVLFSAPGKGCELLPHALADMRTRL
jgi:hypothetical protein